MDPSCVPYENVLVNVELVDGNFSQISYELLSEARRLADKLKVKVIACIITGDKTIHTETIIGYGADIVYCMKDPRLHNFMDDLYAGILCNLINAIHPEIVLLGSTIKGRSIAPRVASKLNTGLTADCTKLDIDMENRYLIQTRPAFAGNVMATIICPQKRPQMVTVRLGMMKLGKFDTLRQGKVIDMNVDIDGYDNMKIIESIDVYEKSGIDLNASNIIFGIGRGIGSKENVAEVISIATQIKAAVGATRPIIENGWMDYSCQIGQTGKSVRPKLYIACGISGAIQHVAGISSAKKILAINKDINAPIFHYANYGIVADVCDILPMLKNKFKC